ncbi:hypothetical protein GCM10025867_43970 [Frondihabitans sucicola]|uniref:VOC family protein n=1 Tax=Frondihabitans sucicola TaxID=1268041 RepID=A0ABM8GUL4_9MICO|nr:hypothetical protein GCM10025867_43970 [Frondihabitans sucicola]
MSASLTPHLNFRGDARAALDFYRSVFGGDVVIVTYADAQAVQDPAQADQVMFGQVEAPSGVRVMAYDVQSALPYDQGVNSSTCRSAARPPTRSPPSGRGSRSVPRSSRISVRRAGRRSTANCATASASCGCSTSSPSPLPDSLPPDCRRLTRPAEMACSVALRELRRQNGPPRSSVSRSGASARAEGRGNRDPLSVLDNAVLKGGNGEA